MSAGTGGCARPSIRGWFLVGPTAAGKTAVAHVLARRTGRAVLSADAMLVYRGLDIGTAKPAPPERAGIAYHGIDLADPSEPFSVWQYVRCVRESLIGSGVTDVIVTGGTGLYVKALTLGLDDAGGPDETVRAQWEQVLRDTGVAGLQAALRARAPERLAALADPLNPRRLIRALEQAESGSPASSWSGLARPRLAGLAVAPEDLRGRIAARTRAMFAGGLLEEAARMDAQGALSRTAAQAIGYAEALACMRGALTRAEAEEETIRRTVRLAKRQRTWFRHQADVVWVPADEGTSPATLAERVLSVWENTGAVPLQV